MQTIWSKVKADLKQKAIPIDVVLELTRKCNLSCCHCYNFKDNAELSFVQVKDIARQLRQAGTLFLSLTGGEIFTKADIFEICFYLRQSCFALSIFTNGTLINQSNIKIIRELDLNEVGISIQGAIAKTHDKIVGCQGAFAKSINAIKLLKNAQIPVNLKCTLMQDNFAEYHDLIKLASELGVPYIIDPVVSPKDDGSKDVLAHRLDEKQLFDFYQNELLEQNSFMQKKEEDPDADFSCPAGTVMASISAKGDVYPCIQLPKKLGNVFDTDFRGIWENSKFLTELREKTNIPACRNCRLAAYCTRCPGLAYLEDGNAFGISSIACINAAVYEKIVKQETLNK
ncbi:MAG: radical SAM protein [Candidatus Omnitrophica bacterium]|nr:radical SAM protein [Candidatus Omnitrophota bacterium]